jgi:hypothetical protein
MPFLALSDVSYTFWVIYLWLFFCIAAGMFAEIRRNRTWAWGVTAFFFSPLVAFTLLAILLPLPSKEYNERAPRGRDLESSLPDHLADLAAR